MPRRKKLDEDEEGEYDDEENDEDEDYVEGQKEEDGEEDELIILSDADETTNDKSRDVQMEEAEKKRKRGEEQGNGQRVSPKRSKAEDGSIIKQKQPSSAPATRSSRSRKKKEDSDDDEDDYEETTARNKKKRKAPTTQKKAKPAPSSSKKKGKNNGKNGATTTTSAQPATTTPDPSISAEEAFFKKRDFVHYYFSALFSAQKKTAGQETPTGEGCVVVEYDSLKLLNMDGKAIGATRLIRKPNDTGEKPVKESGAERVEAVEGTSQIEEMDLPKKKETKKSDSSILNNEEDEEGTPTEVKKPVFRIDEDLLFVIKRGKEVQIMMEPGQTVPIGSKDVQIVDPIDPQEFIDGTFFWKNAGGQEIRQRAVEVVQKTMASKLQSGFRLAAARRPRPGTFQGPRLKKDCLENGEPKAVVSHIHDPDIPGRLVLYRPGQFDKGKFPVVVDPIVGDRLRPHQRDGVRFLYNCITGQGGFKGNGAILADEMGLGKTLQSITLLWTMLRQSPEGKSAVSKAMIVAPSSLVKNWAQEIIKWLGPNKLDVIVIGETKSVSGSLDDFKIGRADLLIISYTQAHRHINALKAVQGLDLVICDEGHRLKNANIKTTLALAQLPTKRKIILSGTPIQNDLEEFFAMIDFVNPGILGKREKFKKIFEEPIVASRQPNATLKEKALGTSRSKMLSRMTKIFILRRTATILQKYLPPKVEYTVFCKVTELQKALYQALLSDTDEENLSEEQKDDALSCITTLKKLCNHPTLVYEMCKKEPATYKKILSLFPPGYNAKDVHVNLSAKIQLLDNLLKEIRKTSDDRVVIVSNYTQLENLNRAQTLEVLCRLCRLRNWGYFQLDGSTAVKQRQNMVNAFNQPRASEFIFLLSSKAGGVGLNLVGANRLVLFDPDWNPACDLQAMARVHRDGQKKQVYIYRFLSTGTIEEKIFQRQVTKQGLATSVVDENTDAATQFTLDDLKDLFKLRTNTLCETHDLLECSCCVTKLEDGEEDERDKKPEGKGFFVRKAKKKDFSGDELAKWDHYTDVSQLQDKMLRNSAGNLVTFVFANESQLEMQFDDAEKENVIIKEEDLAEEAALEKALQEDGDDDEEGKGKEKASSDSDREIDLEEEEEEEEDGDYNGEEEEEED